MDEEGQQFLDTVHQAQHRQATALERIADALESATKETEGERQGQTTLDHLVEGLAGTLNPGEGDHLIELLSVCYERA